MLFQKLIIIKGSRASNYHFHSCNLVNQPMGFQINLWQKTSQQLLFPRHRTVNPDIRGMSPVYYHLYYAAGLLAGGFLGRHRGMSLDHKAISK